MFRVAVKEMLVHPEDSRLDGVTIADVEKQKKFDAMRLDFENGTGDFANCDAEAEALFRKVRDWLMVHRKAR